MIPHSIDSVPELVKKTFSAKLCWHKSFAYSSWSLLKYRLEVCQSLLAWLFNALIKVGWQWPREFTAIPLPKSKYFLFLDEIRYDPFPYVNSIFLLP